MSTQTPPPPLFTQRLLLILLLAFLAGVVFGAVTFAASGNLWVAVAAGLTAFGAALVALHGLVE